MAVIAAIIGRLCIAALFVAAGIGKLMDPAGTAQYITANTTLSGSLAVPTGIFEIVAGIILGLGLMTRLTSIVLAGFTALTIVLFHSQVASDSTQATQALKNLAIIGGLLMVFAYGQVSWRMSTWRERDRRHDAELAAARAEARAERAEDRSRVATTHPDTVVVEREEPRRGLFSRHRSVADRTDGDPRT